MPSVRERELARVINQSWKPLEKWAMSDRAKAALLGAHTPLTGSQIPLPWEQWLNTLNGVHEPLKNETFKAMADMSKKVRPVTANLNFNVLDAVSQRYAAEQTGLLIKSIADGQRQAVQNIIRQAMSGELTVDAAARHLRGAIGLHPAWAKAVASYGDKQLDRLIKDGMTADKAAARAGAMQDRYRERLVRTRAKNIARTEISVASNVGQYAAYEQAVGDGVAHPQAQKEWAPGPGACSICAPIAGERVQWDQDFSNGQKMPPGHPGCRCTTNLLDPTRNYRPIDHLDPNGDHLKPQNLATRKPNRPSPDKPIDNELPGPKLDRGESLKHPGFGNQPKELLRVDQMPVPLGEPLNPLQAGVGANPNWGQPGYTVNCSSVATSYEMRRRGFPVQAGATKTSRYDADYVSNWWHSSDGNPARVERFPDHSMFTDWMTNQPEGARGFVTVSWKQGGGHVFNWEVIKGKVVYIDAQPNKENPAITFRSWATKAKKGSMAAVRMDDKIPNTNVLQGVVSKQ